MKNAYIITLLGGVAFLCFLPLKVTPIVEFSCETPNGWVNFKTKNLRVHRNGTWNFTLKGRDISASNCFLEK